MREYIGNTSQLFDVREYRMSGGKADGVRAIDIWNGADLQFTVLPDRALDIFSVRFRNKNIAFHTPSGVVAPTYYNDKGAQWVRSFGGGLLATCGLQNIGNTDTPPDSDLSVHGRICHTPAENLCVEKADDGLSVTITGTMKEALLFGSNLTLKRTIHCAYGKNTITLTDTITNHSFKEDALSMLYHFNMGYPLLSEDAMVQIPSVKIVPRTPHAATRVDQWQKVFAPEDNFEEMCYYHTLSEKKFGLDNPASNIGIQISFDSPILDHFIQWKMMGKGEYVMGLEPATCTLEGRMDAIENGSQKYIPARSSITNQFKIEFHTWEEK